MLKKVVPLIVALTTSSSALASSAYYVSPLGSDSANGKSSATAWQTITKVNGSDFGPGDVLWIDGGHGPFSGCLSFTSANVKSTSAQPFVVGVYNGAQWTLKSNCGSNGNPFAAITINGVSGITVQDGVLSGNGTYTAYGVWIRNTTLAGPANSIVVKRMDISDFNTTSTSIYSAEVFVTGYPGNGLTNVNILNNKLHGLSVTSLDDNGIDGYGYGQNITATYSGNEIYYTGGRTGGPGGSTGNGIWCTGTKSCEVASNHIHDIGANVNQCGGPVGIGTYSADSSYVHDNEIEHVHATKWNSNTCDFSALDADGESTNGIWERNYTHDNDGPSISFGGAPPVSPWGPNQFRLNISEEDNLQNTNGGGVWALGPTTGGYVYNNTAYRSLNSNGTTAVYCVSLGYNGTYGGGVVANNTCTNAALNVYGQAGGFTDNNIGRNQSALTIINNNYQLSGNPIFSWLGKNYSSLIAFQTATGKDVNSTTLIPLLKSPGNGGDCDGLLSEVCPSAYMLALGSQMEGKGADLSAFGFPLPSIGYYGTPYLNSKGHNVGADSSIPGANPRVVDPQSQVPVQPTASSLSLQSKPYIRPSQRQ
jgi:hypothetical protein